jgi:hypothetical protein
MHRPSGRAPACLLHVVEGLLDVVHVHFDVFFEESVHCVGLEHGVDVL